jgi:hypothetical protein
VRNHTAQMCYDWERDEFMWMAIQCAPHYGSMLYRLLAFVRNSSVKLVLMLEHTHIVFDGLLQSLTFCVRLTCKPSSH